MRRVARQVAPRLMAAVEHWPVEARARCWLSEDWAAKRSTVRSFAAGSFAELAVEELESEDRRRGPVDRARTAAVNFGADWDMAVNRAKADKDWERQPATNKARGNTALGNKARAADRGLAERAAPGRFRAEQRPTERLPSRGSGYRWKGAAAGETGRRKGLHAARNPAQRVAFQPADCRAEPAGRQQMRRASAAPIAAQDVERWSWQ